MIEFKRKDYTSTKGENTSLKNITQVKKKGLVTGQTKV